MSLPLPPNARAASNRAWTPPFATLLLLAALAWATVILWSRSTAMMDAMPGRSTVTDAALFAGTWLVMMAAMMLPAIAPIVVMFRTIQRQRGSRGNAAVPPSTFVAGYLVVWTLAGIVADLVYMAAQATGDRIQAGSGAVPYIGGGIIILAGLYQFSPLKNVCLAHCRSPFHIILHGWHEGRAGALRMGASHGLYCLGCCWGIMAVLFVVGLMNLAWMAALSVLIVAEKLAPRGVAIGRLVGVLFIALGIVMAVQPRWFPASGLVANETMQMNGVAPASAPIGQSRYAVTAGPYALTLLVASPSGMGMDGGQRRLVVTVKDSKMGMAVSDAQLTMRISGMGAPSAALSLHPVASGMGGMADGQYEVAARLMAGTYSATIRVNGVTATVPLRLG